MKDKDWHEQARCSGYPDPDLWHYENSHLPDEQELEVLRSVQAIEICNECPVRTQCLKQGMEQENLIVPLGIGSIWGGYLTSERLVMSGIRVRDRVANQENRHRINVRKKIATLKE